MSSVKCRLGFHDSVKSNCPKCGRDVLKEWKIGFWLIVILFSIFIIMPYNVESFTGKGVIDMIITNPEDPKAVCYAKYWSWQEYEQCVETIGK